MLEGHTRCTKSHCFAPRYQASFTPAHVAVRNAGVVQWYWSWWFGAAGASTVSLSKFARETRRVRRGVEGSGARRRRARHRGHGDAPLTDPARPLPSPLSPLRPSQAAPHAIPSSVSIKSACHAAHPGSYRACLTLGSPALPPLPHPRHPHIVLTALHARARAEGVGGKSTQGEPPERGGALRRECSLRGEAHRRCTPSCS